MHHPAAIAFNEATGQSQQITARVYERLLEGIADPDTRARYMALLQRDGTLDPRAIRLQDPDDGAPLVFRRGYSRFGHEEDVRAHFAYAAGYAPPVEHFLDHAKETFEEAVLGGKVVRLSHNLDLSYRALDFRDLANRHAWTREAWEERNLGNYVSVSAKSVKDSIQAIHKVAGLAPNDWKSRIFSLYRGGVLPYSDFYLDAPATSPQHRTRRINLFDDMYAGLKGVAFGDARSVGAPRIIRFVPTQSTVLNGIKSTLRGNVIQPQPGEEQVLRCDNLIITDKKRQGPGTVAFHSFWNMLRDHRRDGVYVEASPLVARDQRYEDVREPGDKLPWKITHWLINDIERQVTPAGQFGKPGQRPQPEAKGPDQNDTVGPLAGRDAGWRVDRRHDEVPASGAGRQWRGRGRSQPAPDNADRGGQGRLWAPSEHYL